MTETNDICVCGHSRDCHEKDGCFLPEWERERDGKIFPTKECSQHCKEFRNHMAGCPGWVGTDEWGYPITCHGECLEV